MSFMQDKIRLPAELGAAIRAARKRSHIKTVEVARQAGRSRDVLHRLELGEDVTVASLFDILRALKLRIRLEPDTLPTLEEMRAQFAVEDDVNDDLNSKAGHAA